MEVEVGEDGTWLGEDGTWLEEDMSGGDAS